MKIGKMGLILGVKTCQTHGWRKTKKTKEPRDHETITKPKNELTEQRKNVTGSYTEVNPKMANDHRCVPLCNNYKRYDSGQDLSYSNFPRDKRRRL